MYHIIFVYKYRKKILEPIEEKHRPIIHYIEKEIHFEILEMEADKDHIHPLVKSKPKVCTLAIIRKLKQDTTIKLWKTQKEYLKKILLERIYTMK